ncbi:hypothetical protein Srufu_080150 (plasmid) [Streptomyces libani subsp. rufus]|nr:hypothetical protein Srufu_080150 [Streptomyces libani subsp. rufus]
MTEQRDRIARSMAEAAGSMCFRQAGAEWEHLRSVWRGHADAALVVIGRDVEHLRGRAEKAETAIARAESRLTVWEQRLPETVNLAPVIETIRRDLAIDGATGATDGR